MSLAAVLLAAPTRRTSHTLAASNLVAAWVPDGLPRLVPEDLESLSDFSPPLGLNASSVCAPRSSQFWLLGSHHKTGTELVSCSQPLWALAPCDS